MDPPVYARSFSLASVKQQTHLLLTALLLVLTGGSFALIQWVALPHQAAGDRNYGVTVALLLLTFLLMVLAAFKNPGEFPKIVRVELTQRRRGDQAEIPYTSWTDSASVVNMCLAHSFDKIKFCKTCRIYRPPRTTHCRVCDRCVSQFDHHCTLLGTCIGRNNYRAYFFFLFSASLLSLSLVGFSFKILFDFNAAELQMTVVSWSLVAGVVVVNLLNLTVTSS